MTRLRSAVFACVLFAAAAIAQQQPQPEPKSKTPIGSGQPKRAATVPQPVVVALLDYIGDETLTAELKLAPDQLKKLTDYRQQVWDARYTSTPSDFQKGIAERAQATEAIFRATLSPQQFERARLFAARLIVRPGSGAGFGRPADGTTSLSGLTVAQYPELASILKLTDEQKTKLNERPKAQFGSREPYSTITFDKAQTAVIEQLLGPAPAKPFVQARDPRLSFSTLIPADLRLLNIADVQAELKLAPPQIAAVKELTAKWSPRNVDAAGQDRSPQDRHKQIQGLHAELGDVLARLNPDQTVRLSQVRAQQVVRNRPPHARYLSADVEKAVATSEPQKQLLAAIAAQWEADIAKAFDAGETYEPTRKRVDVATATMHEKSLAVLMPDQAAKVKAIYGAPYTGRFDDPRFGSPANQRDPTDYALNQRRAAFGRYNLELLQLARNVDVQIEIRMTPEQIKKAEAALAELLKLNTAIVPPSTVDGSEKYHAERSAFTAKAIPAILDADQQKRFHQIMMQLRNQPPSTFPPGVNTVAIYTAAAYPGVAEAIKLTPEQKAKLIAGESADDVLNADQRAAIQSAMGTPYTGRTAAPPVASPRTTPSRISLLASGRFDVALKITPEQKTKLAAINTEYQAASRNLLGRTGPGGGGGLNNDDRIKAIAELSAKLDRDIAAALTPEQMKRVPQLELQIEAAADLRLTLRQHEAALALTPEQLQKLDAIDSDAHRLSQLLNAQNIPTANERPIALRLRDRTDDRMLAVLAEPQKAKWKELTGEPANFPKSLIGAPPDRSGGPSGGFNPAPKKQ